MNDLNYFSDYFKKINNHLQRVDIPDLEMVAKMFLNTSNHNRKIICIGNGGSAAMSSHVTVDLTKAAGIRAVNFNEADLLTCFANDYGYENWISEALEFYADNGDMVILISSSGKSLNIINGAKFAKEMDLTLVTLSGFEHDNPLCKLGEINLWVDSTSYNIVEMTHQTWLLAIVDYLIEKKK